MPLSPPVAALHHAKTFLPDKQISPSCFRASVYLGNAWCIRSLADKNWPASHELFSAALLSNQNFDFLYRAGISLSFGQRVCAFWVQSFKLTESEISSHGSGAQFEYLKKKLMRSVSHL